MRTSTRITAAAVAFMAAASALAATTTTSFNPQFGADPFAPVFAVGQPSTTGTLGRFDSTLGTLTGAHLSLFRAYNGYINPTTRTAVDYTGFTVDGSVQLAVTSTLASLDPLLTDLDSTGQVLGDTDPSLYIWVAGNYDAVFSRPGDTVELDLASILPSLTGPGSFSITCQASGTARTANPNVNLNYTVGGTCGATLTYTYTPNSTDPGTVPEPGALALAGLALAGAAIATRRRRRG